MLTFRSGGWILILAFLLVSAVIAWRMVAIVKERTVKAVGDGEHVESYGFDLSTLLVSRETLVASGMPKDGLRSIGNPSFLSPDEAEAYALSKRGKYMKATDRVIGVAINGESRTYPLRVLNWHEIVNDTVGGRAICVTYSPLCDSAVVFDRTVDGEILDLGFSGLLSNSNLVMYDRRQGEMGTGGGITTEAQRHREGDGMEGNEGDANGAEASDVDESLWSQLECRAVAGPAAKAGKKLEIIPCAVTRWDAWRSLHPDTRVLAPDPLNNDRYRRDPYANYYGTPDQLRFPAEPKAPKREGLEWKTPVIVVRDGGMRRVVPIPAIAERAGKTGKWIADWGGGAVEFRCDENGVVATATRPDGTPPDEVVYTFWFAWYAAHPDSAEKEVLPPLD